MILASLQSILNSNQPTDYFQAFINSFLQSHMYSTYSTHSFTDCLQHYAQQTNHPAQSLITSFLSSWLTQPGLPLLMVYPSVNAKGMVTSVSFAQKQFLLNSQRHIPTHFAITFTLNQNLTVYMSTPTKTIRLPSPIPLSQLSISLSPYLPAVVTTSQSNKERIVKLDPVSTERILREVRSQYLLVRQGTQSVNQVGNEDEDEDVVNNNQHIYKAYFL